MKCYIRDFGGWKGLEVREDIEPLIMEIHKLISGMYILYVRHSCLALLNSKTK